MLWLLIHRVSELVPNHFFFVVRWRWELYFFRWAWVEDKESLDRENWKGVFSIIMLIAILYHWSRIFKRIQRDLNLYSSDFFLVFYFIGGLIEVHSCLAYFLGSRPKLFRILDKTSFSRRGSFSGMWLLEVFYRKEWRNCIGSLVLLVPMVCQGVKGFWGIKLI